jgi:prolyl oligopeptidase
MQRLSIIFLFLIITLIGCQTEETSNESTTQAIDEHIPKKAGQLYHPDYVKLIYPKTPKGDVVDHYFGTTIKAPYRWLEGSNDPMVDAWVDKQAKVASNYLNALGEKEAFETRLTEVWNFEKYGAPQEAGDYFYFRKNDGLQNQAILYRTKDLLSNSKIEKVLDPNKLSEDGTVALMYYWFSKNGRYMAFSTSESGSDWQKVQVMDLETNTLLSDEVNWVRYSNVSWYKNGFFYSRYDANEGADKYSAQNEFHQLYYHKLGSKQADDELIFADRTQPKYNFSPQVTEDEQFLIIYVTESTSGNGLVYKRLGKSGEYVEALISNFQHDFEVIVNRGSKLIIRTNYKAPNYQLIEIDLKKPEEKHWNILIPQMPDVLEDVVVVGRRLVLKYNKDVRHILKVHEIDGSFVGNIKMPDIIGTGTPISIDQLWGKKGPNQGSFVLSSYMQAPTSCLFDVQTLKAIVWKAPEIDFNPEAFVIEQVFFKYKDRQGDSVRIPMSIVHKKGLKYDGQNPTLLYGYGGFNISLMPRFALAYLPFLERGGIYAVANIRGGGEYGVKWHEAGTLLNKQNVFDDFIAAAEYLIEKKYSSSEKLAIEGGSNGGLLVGACMTQRPELFRVAIPVVGVLDMLRYHKFTIGRFWATDYGLSENQQDFNNLLSYSPLHNVAETKYPATLIMTGDHDDRVVPAHSYKFAAALQDKQQSHLPIILRVDQKAGHGAGKPTNLRIQEAADKLAFLWFNLQ